MTTRQPSWREPGVLLHEAVEVLQIAEAERKGDVELLNKLLAEKYENRQRLTRISGNLSKVSVDRAAETVAGG